MEKNNIKDAVRRLSLSAIVAMSLSGCPTAPKREDPSGNNFGNKPADPNWHYRLTGPRQDTPAYRQRPDYALPGY